MAKKYLTEEERLEARRAYSRKWRAEHKQEIAEYNANYRQEHRTEILEREAKYRKEHKDEILEQQARCYQKRKGKKAEYNAKYHREHREELLEYRAKYNQEHKNEKAEYRQKIYNTKEGRAKNLIRNYKRIDKKYGRGECDLTVPWFIRNIFTKCIYCGESDWKKLGCDRIDNSKGHTIENVVPACWDCNNNRKNKPFEQFYWEMKHEKTLEDLAIS